MNDILVHACCAVDSFYFLKKLRENFPSHRIVCFFYDPNIHPPEEYKLRLVETLRVCRYLGIEFVEGEYDPENWLKAVKGLEKEPERGKRCDVCFYFRLEKTAQLAKDLNCNSFTTTLLMSPKKDFSKLVQTGNELAEKYSLHFLTVNYRKGNGVQNMFKLAKQNKIYLQDYCGCLYAMKKISEAFNTPRSPGSSGELLFIKELRLKAESLNLPAEEGEFPFLNWKVIEGGLWKEGKAIPSYILPYSQSIKGKVRADVKGRKGNMLFLNKQFIRIILTEKPESVFLEEPRVLTEPTFLVPLSYSKEFLNGRIEASLKTEFGNDISHWLAIGDLSADCIVGIPADTLQSGKGWSLEKAYSYLIRKKEEIKRGKLTLVFLGAYSLCKVSKKHFELTTGRKIETVLPY